MTMFGRFWACAIALGAVSAVVDASAASAAPAVRVVRHKLIGTSSLAWLQQLRRSTGNATVLTALRRDMVVSPPSLACSRVRWLWILGRSEIFSGFVLG